MATRGTVVGPETPSLRPEQAALLPLSRSRRPSSRRRREVWAQSPKGIHQFLTALDPQGFDAENRDRLGHIRVCDNRIPGEVHTRASLEDKAQGGAVKSDHAFRWREAYGINFDHFSIFGEHSAYPLPVPVLVGEPGGRNHREPLTLRRDEEAVLSLLGAKELEAPLTKINRSKIDDSFVLCRGVKEQTHASMGGGEKAEAHGYHVGHKGDGRTDEK